MKKIRKDIYTAIFGLVSFFVGIVIRLNARNIVWPSEYSYSGERENTVWAIKELAVNQISTAVYIFGLIVILLVIAKVLFYKNIEY